jgi:hypothetical protein
VTTQVLSKQGVTSSTAAPSRDMKNIPTQPTPEEVDPNEARSLRPKARAVQRPAASAQVTKQLKGRNKEPEASRVLFRGPRQKPKSRVPQVRLQELTNTPI